MISPFLLPEVLYGFPKTSQGAAQKSLSIIALTSYHNPCPDLEPARALHPRSNKDHIHLKASCYCQMVFLTTGVQQNVQVLRIQDLETTAAASAIKAEPSDLMP